MHDERIHPLLSQIPLTVNPRIDLPKPPTLPHTYTSLPSTLPPSAVGEAYVTSASGFSAHPSAIASQNKALLTELDKTQADADAKAREWVKKIHDRDLAEKRRKAPGWLDSETHLLQPEPVETKPADTKTTQKKEIKAKPVQMEEEAEAQVDDLGAAMDRAFGTL
ncbi:hypothetical protein K470DRAFT_280385 [Piedraia hortae CBS 480.64]|uniref:Uncharacterized protein n=1 Tax=Piedraia hortae CBS 480.64 TaxID=1314780 RepID=A0A6A7C685_9PEZI|nr:hypothetical protein K470DRAFT_280385 [Piedraia hortae CBS 480.64]